MKVCFLKTEEYLRDERTPNCPQEVSREDVSEHGRKKMHQVSNTGGDGVLFADHAWVLACHRHRDPFLPCNGNTDKQGSVRMDLQIS